jgi:hypothetical protein
MGDFLGERNVGEGGKEMLMSKYDQIKLYMYEKSIMKLTKQCCKM